jgi:hypothetical protein
VKNQYFGDINDYFKYGMLRTFARHVSVAVIWMRTADDGSSDGNKLSYLDHDGRRGHDPELFDWLRDWKRSGAPKDVRLIEQSGLLPNCTFFDEIVPDDLDARAEWFARAREFAKGAGLVFLDPDKGLPAASTRPGTKGWSQYVAREEVKALHDDGHSLLVYQHLWRVSRRDFMRDRLRELYETLEVEHFTSFSSGDWVGFLIHGDGGGLSGARRAIMRQWDTAIHVSNDFVIPVPISAREIKARPIREQERRITRMTTTPGYVNRNRQEVLRRTDTPGTDHGQVVYVLRCSACSREYGVNGSGIWQAKCPACQGGALSFE